MAATTTGSANAPLPATAASVGQVFLDRVAASGSKEAFREPTADGGWRSWTWAETATWVRSLAAGLLALGVQPQDRVAIASSTRLEWIHADLAVMLAGGATTTVYPSTQADDVAFILSDSGSRIVIAEDEKQLSKLLEVRDQIPAVEKVVMIDGVSEGDWVMDLDELARLGDAYLADHPTAVDDAVSAVIPEHLATLIYTSGTTGRPKGVELTHGNWTYEGACIQALEILRPDHVHFLWLPLSHSFGKVLLSAQLQIGLVTVVDGRVDRIVENLSIIKPSVMAAAPRIFEKVYARVVSTTEAEGGVKAKIFAWAFDVGLKAVRLEAEGQAGPGAARGAAQGRRQARLHQDPRPHGWADRVLRVGQRRAVPRDRRVVQRRRAADPRGLRPDGDLGRHLREPPRQLPDRHRRRAPAGHRDQDRRRTARSWSAGRASCAATRACRTRPPRCSRVTAGSPPATSARSTTAAGSASPTGRRTSSRPAAASTSRRRPSRRRSSRSHRWSARWSSTQRAATTRPRS